MKKIAYRGPFIDRVVTVKAILNSSISIISSNCLNGPEEILAYGKGGYILENDNKETLITKLEKAFRDNQEEENKKKIACKKSIKKFNIFSHTKLLERILN